MSQILRPISTITSTNIASGDHTSIDEVSANDSDYIRTNPLDYLETATYECLLSPPTGKPGPGTSTIYYRNWEEGGQLFDLRWWIYQGAIQIATGSLGGVASTPFTDTGTADLSAIADWTDVRARFRWTGDAAGARGRLSQAYLEVPDPLPVSGMMLMFD